ncbi:MAG: hypothetical protein QGI15_02820, partial [Candidatus Scalindua sp.]|nr:hypothetical protein [Candidatus Scalindua sp.]
MRYITITGFMVVCLLAVYNGQAGGEDDFKVKTGVYVRGEENINGLIENYIGKELGNLGNVI